MWEALKLEQYERADSIRGVLSVSLMSELVEVKRWTGQGIMQNYLLTFDGGVRGFFKVAGSDTAGPIRIELAAYEIDKLLHFHLTPMTLIREVVLPDGNKTRGVIKYLVGESETAMESGISSEIKPDILLFFDTIIANADRHLGNWMIRADTKELFAIDHNRTFQFGQEWTWYQRMRTIRDPGTLGIPYERYQSLPEDAFRNALASHLTDEQVNQFLRCRDIVLRFLGNTVKG